MSAVELKNVTKTFRHHTAVENLSLDVPRGCIYGFIGPNGSGKTTTLRIIMNILYPDTGDVLIFDRKLGEISTDIIGYMPEERGIYRRMKVRELLQFFAVLKNSSVTGNEVDSWLKRMDLTAWADKKVETLSKGMSQKVQFIATVIARPQLVILDEPFTGLDPVNTEIIRDAILELNAAGTTVIFSTHDMAMAENMCDYIFMIFQGRKVLDGTLSSIKDRYGDDTIRLKTSDGREVLEHLEGIHRICDLGHSHEFRVEEGYDPQQILTKILKKSRVESFSLLKPSLHDIFIRIARPEKQEVTDA